MSNSSPTKIQHVSVVWVSESLSGPGGSEYSTLAFCKLLSDAGARVSIVAPPGILKSWARLAEECGISICVAKGNSDDLILNAVHKQCLEQKANVVQFIPWSNILSKWSDICPDGIATVALEPTSADQTCWWLPKPEDAPTDALAVLNPSAQSELEKRLNGSTPVFLVPNLLLPVDALPRPKNSRKIGVVARLSEEKGLAYLLAALSLLPSEFGDVTLHIFGEGSEKARLQMLTTMLGIKERVVFEGIFEPYYGLATALNDITIAVLPSLFEGFPIVLMEFMALEIPIVASKTSGALSALGDYKYLVNIGDTGSMAKALSELLSSFSEQEKAIEWGRSRIHSMLNRKQALKAFSELYTSVIVKS